MTAPAADILLALETSNPSARRGDEKKGSGGGVGGAGGPGVALGRLEPGGVTLIGAEALAPASRHDDDLMPAIDRLFRRAGVKPEQIARVAVSVGPGGYTAVRVAVATAKMIVEARRAAVGDRAGAVAVPSALVVAMRAPAVAHPLGVALAGKGDSAWIAVFPPGWRRLPPAGRAELGATGRVVTAAELGGMGLGTLIADAHLPAPLRAEAEARGIRILPPDFDPIAVLEAAAELSPMDPAELAPIYPREPDAVTLWRKLHPR